MRTRVKFCGLTRLVDVDVGVGLGVDAIGLVFHPASPRAVEPAQAARLVAALPAFVSAVGLFVDAEPDQVRAVLAQVPLAALQFHGAEPPEYCRSFDRPWIKSVAVRPGVDLAVAARRYAGASSLLFDTYDARLAGGTGRRFDWSLLPSELAGRHILAGGLSAETVAEAIRQLRPYAVDVSGGIEQAKGVKDPGKMTDFMKGVRDGDQS
ncbi:MAG: phosphoribosylanthranilate isomerase [Halochromatium sp.]|nr:phosphoribosylanthranilate isomerase [Halochromatium sp.]